MNVKCLEVSSCCWFASLRTGTKIFGFISLIGCFLLALLSAWELAVVAKHAPEEFKAMAVLLTADISLQAVQMATSVLLLMGAFQEKSHLLRPWLVTAVVGAVLEVVFLPSLFGRLTVYSDEGIEWVLVTAFMLLDDVYGWLVVYSYHQTLTPQGEGMA